jgi:hypothetical protein
VRRQLGSSIAFLIGCLAVIAGLSGLAQTVDNPHVAGTQKLDTLIGGVVMILGALAYRSAKKRKLGEAKVDINAPVLGHCLTRADLRFDTGAK